MRFIKKWAFSCAKYLTTQLDQDHTKRGVYYYGFQIVIGSLVKGTILMGSSILLGSFIATMIIMLTFALFRMLAGGCHMDTYGKCLGASMVLFLLPAAIIQHTYKMWDNEFTFIIYAFICITLLISLPVLLRWAPADTPNKPITKPSQIKRLKTLSVIFLALWFFAAIVLTYNGLLLYAVATGMGILLETFTVTPAGYGFFDRIGGKLNAAG